MLPGIFTLENPDSQKLKEMTTVINWPELHGSVLECACQATLGIHIVGSVLIFILLKREKRD